MTDFTITRIFDAPRELVFKAWTDPKYIAQWWGPQHYTCPSCSVDLRVGGAFLFCMRSPQGTEIWNKGLFREIQAPEKIVSVMYFADPQGNVVEPSYYGVPAFFPSEMRDIVTFEVHEDSRTKLTLRRNHPESLAKQMMEDQGWSQSLDRFAAALAIP
jgi:uncharacterized protein YndB with AHSA1/START domain